jgi:hypothetical protein
MDMSKPKRAQSAMEYLMTYGWAILIIAVVLAALFSLGVFNATNFAPKAPAGSCKLFRSTAITSLEGECANLIPQSVVLFNGQNGYIITGTTGFPVGNSPRSAFAWIRIKKVPVGSSIGVIMNYGSTGTKEFSGMYINSGGFLTFTYYGSDYITSFTPAVNAWYFIGYTYSGGTNVIVYENGQSQTGTIPTLNTVLPTSDPSDIGRASNNYVNLPDNFNGTISNVQLYNTSLDPAQVQGLYMEGIGGDPIDIKNLVGWWPLNGDTIDYSGNMNNGAPNNDIFTSSWTSGYNPP